MERAYSKEIHTGFWRKNQEERDQQKYLGTAETDLKEAKCGGMDWIEQAQERDNSGFIQCPEIREYLDYWILLGRTRFQGVS